MPVQIGLIPVSLPELPGVAHVERHGPTDATRRIIHLLDWHYVSEEDYVADVGSLDDYDEFLDEVEEVQRQQLVILRSLGAKQVYIEGLTDEDLFIFDARIRALRKHGARRRDLLEIGAAGQLLLNGEIEVLPLEDSAAYFAAEPIRDGEVVLDQEKIEARQNGMVRRLVDEPVAVIVLGGAHDLSDNVGNTTEYVRVAGPYWQEHYRGLTK